MCKKTTAIKVAVAMSGGIDSSVAALILKKQVGIYSYKSIFTHIIEQLPILFKGYDVVGVYMKSWENTFAHFFY